MEINNLLNEKSDYFENYLRDGKPTGSLSGENDDENVTIDSPKSRLISLAKIIHEKNQVIEELKIYIEELKQSSTSESEKFNEKVNLNLFSFK